MLPKAISYLNGRVAGSAGATGGGTRAAQSNMLLFNSATDFTLAHTLALGYELINEPGPLMAAALPYF